MTLQKISNFLGFVRKEPFKSIFNLNFRDFLKVASFRQILFKTSEFLLIAFVFAFSFSVYQEPLLASNSLEAKIFTLQKKASKNIAKKFCNSIGFGISQESSIKFAIGENEKEISRNKYFSNMNKKQFREQISSEIVDSCGMPTDLVKQEDIDGLESYLIRFEILK